MRRRTRVAAIVAAVLPLAAAAGDPVTYGVALALRRYERDRDPAQARQALAALAAPNGGPAAPWCALGRVELSERRWAAAAAALEQCCARRPGGEVEGTARARLAIAKGLANDASPDAERSGRYALAIVDARGLLAAGRPLDAARVAAAANALDPARFEAWDVGGTATAAAGDPGVAMTMWGEALARAPAAEQVRLAEATRFAARERRFRAAAAGAAGAHRAADARAAAARWIAALEADPDSPPAAIGAISELLLAGDAASADAVALHAASLPPRPVDVLLATTPALRARVSRAPQRQQLVGLWSKAEHERDAARREAILRELLRVAPRHVGARWALGDLLAATGRLDEAIENERAGVEAVPGIFAGHRRLALALLAAGREADARTAIARAAELAPAEPTVAIAQGRLELESGHADAALSFARTALASDPEEPGAHLLLGRALLAGRAPADAEAPLRRAVGLAPWAPACRVALAGALFALDRRDAGRAETAVVGRLPPPRTSLVEEVSP